MFYVLLRQVKVHGWRTLLTHPDVLGEHSYTILEQGVNERTARVDSFRRWDLFTRIEASEHHIYLFLSDTAAAIVPVRAFSGRSEAARFLERARASWHASRSLAPGSAQDSEPLGARGDASP